MMCARGVFEIERVPSAHHAFADSLNAAPASCEPAAMASGYFFSIEMPPGPTLICTPSGCFFA